MKIKQLTTIAVTALLSQPVFAQQSNDVPPPWLIEGLEWVDTNHKEAQFILQKTAKEIDSWFGMPEVQQSAEAQLRILLDTHWDQYNGWILKPRLRGKIKLPALKERLNLVFGDDTIDNELDGAANIASESTNAPKKLNLRQARRENSSVGLQWELPDQLKDVKTRFSLGLRSGGDIYAKIKVSKEWHHSSIAGTRTEFIYRYGLKSRHYIRSNTEFSYAPTEQAVNSNQFSVEYYHNRKTDGWSWANNLSRKHPTGKDTWFNYGLHVGGHITNGGVFSINSYGPFAGLRTHLYSDWLFVQPELTYYNDKVGSKNHHVGIMIRLEAQF